MNTYFKDCKLSDTFKQTTSIVTAVSRINSKDIIFKSTDAVLNRDKDFYVKDIARATSAAPTYFPSA
jgi:patatin-like phospholipase/acyl hydrolase